MAAFDVSTNEQIDQVFETVGYQTPLVVPDTASFSTFLLKHPTLMAAFPQTLRVLSKTLDEDAQVVAGVFREPESGNEYLALSLRLRTYDASTFGLLQRLNAEIEKAVGNEALPLLVTTDFEPLR